MSSVGAVEQGQDFPPELVRVPLESRLRSRRGWGFGVVAAAAMPVAGVYFLFFVLGGFTDIQMLEVFGGALAVGALAAGVQAARLLKPITLALAPGRLGVYEGDRLARSATMGDLIEYRLNLTNTVREFMLFGMLGVGGLVGAVAYAVDALNDGSVNAILPITGAAAAGVACVGLFANSIWTRAMAKHYFVRGSGKHYTVVLQKSDLRRVGWLK